MLNKKLFKKLNEQMELNSILNEEITDEEIAEVEKNVIFGEANKNRINDLDMASKSASEKKQDEFKSEYYEDHKTELNPENYKHRNKEDK